MDMVFLPVSLYTSMNWYTFFMNGFCPNLVQWLMASLGTHSVTIGTIGGAIIML